MKLHEITSPDALKRAISNECCLICCGTSWSMPCRKQYAILQRLAGEHIRPDCIVTLDIEKYPDAAALLTIQSIPTTIVFSNGREAGRFVGLKSHLKLHDALDRISAPCFTHRRRSATETVKHNQSNLIGG